MRLGVVSVIHASIDIVRVIFSMTGLILVLAPSLGCSLLAQPQDSSPTLESPPAFTVQQPQETASIDAITREQAGQVIYLQGTVQQQAPLLTGQLYLLQDATGQIWVKTEQALPEVGDRIVIEGKVIHQAIALPGQEAGELYIEEISQLERQPSASETEGLE